MTSEKSYLDETFHKLSQPVMAMRATLELALEGDGTDVRQALGETLLLLEQLTRDLALLREMTGLGDTAVLSLCAAGPVLWECVEEMLPVARAGSVKLHARVVSVRVLCNEEVLRRALFVLLDALIAAGAPGSEVCLQLADENGMARLESRPMLLDQMRSQLCCRLLEHAGANVSHAADGGLVAMFRSETCRQIPAKTSADEGLLTAG
jgi:signal transduction histidine kinase